MAVGVLDEHGAAREPAPAAVVAKEPRLGLIERLPLDRRRPCGLHARTVVRVHEVEPSLSPFLRALGRHSQQRRDPLVPEHLRRVEVDLPRS